jgi:hypothetical protein
MMAYLLSDLWIEMKYRLIKMFIVLLNISDYNLFSIFILLSNKGNNKITELRTILQRESQNS